MANTEERLTIHTDIPFSPGTRVLTTIVESEYNILVSKELYSSELSERGMKSGVCFEIEKSSTPDIEAAVVNALKQLTRRIHERIDKGDV